MKKLKRTRMQADDRKNQLIAACIKLSLAYGYQNVTRRLIARECNVTEGNVSRFLGTMTNVKRDIIRHAIKAVTDTQALSKEAPELQIIAQGLSVKDIHAMKASAEIKKEAAEFITTLQ